jgi:hypothetical protein
LQTALILFGVIVAVGVLYVLVPVMFAAYRRASSRAMIRCPDTGKSAALQFDAGHAAWTAAIGNPRLRIENCSLWPERRNCQQRCLQALS